MPFHTLQESANSVAVIASDQLDDKAASATVSEVIGQVPNVFFPSTTSAPVIRGVDSDGPLVGGNAYLAKPIPRATLSVDGRYVSLGELSSGGATTWDVGSVEVYRGPQTTSQGANAIAGAVVVNTKDPTFTPETAAQLVYGSRNKHRLSFATSGPLNDDIAARIALDYSGRDTFITYTNADFTEPDFDYDFKSWNGRLKLLWQPQDLPGLEAKLTYSHTDLHRPRWEAVSKPYDRLESNSESQDYLDVVSDGAILDTSYEFENGLRLTNQLQYSKSDYDFTFAYPYSGTAARYNRNVNNELKLTFGDQEDVWSGVAGIYYSDEKSQAEFANTYFGAPFGSADLDYRTKSTALYGEATWRFAPQWALTGGLRYQRDNIRISGTTSFVDGKLDYEDTFSAVMPTLTLAYDVRPELTVGAMAGKGYLAGGAGTNFRGREYYRFDPETAWNYEMFVRGNALDGKLNFTGNLFYTEYKDIQRSVTNCLDADCTVTQGSMIVNGERAKSYGLELSADYQVTPALFLSGSLGALETEVTEFSDHDGNKYEGNAFANSPSYTVRLAAAWDITPKVKLSGDAMYIDGYYSSDTNEPETEVSGYAIANTRLSYLPNEKLEYFAYANNLFDRRAPLSASLSGDVELVEPREVGIGVNLKF